MRVAIQGQKGSFHDIASQKIWTDKSPELVYCDSFRAVFELVDKGEVDFGLSAIENSLYGSIHEVFDLLLKHRFWISGETTLPIHQQFITHPDATLADITEVYSHPVALDQCRNWLADNLPGAEIVEAADTAGAVEFIKQNHLQNAAAIASEAAAAGNDMPILYRDIEDEKNNFTRFIVIGKNRLENSLASKATISLTAHHKPGALYGALGILSSLDINLTKLESRPIRNQKFLYQFIIDMIVDAKKLKQAMAQLQNYGSDATLLGHFVTHD